MPDDINARERITQNRVVQLFQDTLGYRYLGNWQYCENNHNIEHNILEGWLASRVVSRPLINCAISKLEKVSTLGDENWKEYE